MSRVINWGESLPPPMKEAIGYFRIQLGQQLIPWNLLKGHATEKYTKKELRLDEISGSATAWTQCAHATHGCRCDARGRVCTLPTRGRQSREVSDFLRPRLPMPTVRNWQHDGATEQPQRPSPESWGHPISSPVRCVFEPGWPSLTPRRGERSVARLIASAPLEHLPTNGVEKG